MVGPESMRGRELERVFLSFGVGSVGMSALQKRLLLATTRVRHNNTKSRRRLLVPTAIGRRLPSVKALSVILYYRQGRS